MFFHIKSRIVHTNFYIPCVEHLQLQLKLYEGFIVVDLLETKLKQDRQLSDISCLVTSRNTISQRDLFQVKSIMNLSHALFIQVSLMMKRRTKRILHEAGEKSDAGLALIEERIDTKLHLSSTTTKSDASNLLTPRTRKAMPR